MRILYVVRYISNRGEEIERYFHRLESALTYARRTTVLFHEIALDDIRIYEATITSWSLRRVDKEG